MNAGAIILLVGLGIFIVVECVSLVTAIKKNKLKKQELEQNKINFDGFSVPTNEEVTFEVNSEKEEQENERNGDID